MGKKIFFRRQWIVEDVLMAGPTIIVPFLFLFTRNTSSIQFLNYFKTNIKLLELSFGYNIHYDLGLLLVFTTFSNTITSYFHRYHEHSSVANYGLLSNSALLTESHDVSNSQEQLFPQNKLSSGLAILSLNF